MPIYLSDYMTKANTVGSVDVQEGAITSEKISGGLSPKITTINYPGNVLAANVYGGETIELVGSGFADGFSVVIGSTNAPTTTFTNSTSVSFTTPNLLAQDYTLYVINPDGGTGISIPGLSYSGVPSLSNAAGALTATTEAAYTETINAISDSNVTYSVSIGALPTGFSLDANTGIISGTMTAPDVNNNSNTNFTFTLAATDEENQEATRQYSILYVPTLPTWITASPLTDAGIDVEYTAYLNAISNSNVVYTIPSGNVTDGNINVSGNALIGTANTANEYYFTVRATDQEGHFTDKDFVLTVAVSGDDNFADTVLLLNGDGADGAQNNTFLDSSINTHTITRNGNPTQGSFSPFSPDEGMWGNYFDGTGDYLNIPHDASFTLDGAFTIEMWVNFDSQSQSYWDSIVSIGKDATDSATSGNGSTIYHTNSTSGGTDGSIVFQVGTGNRVFSTEVLRGTGWRHVAATRDASNVCRLFVDGVEQGTSLTASDSVNATKFGARIGHGNDSQNNFYDGYVSNFRVVKGTAVYTSAFTPPTDPLTAITNTSLLTCQSNRFVDNSSNAHSITVNGDTKVVPFSPFAPSTAYDPATKGGSGYFDGTGDWLTSSSDVAFGTSDFTLECWVYIVDAGSGFRGILSCFTSAIGPVIELYNGNWAYYMTGSGVDTSISATKNTWHHVALTRSGSNFYYFVNGTQIATGSNSTNYSCDLVTIGTLGSPTYTTSYELNGYISNARVIKGTAVYTSAFTPPTAPLTAVSGTSLLCNFSNAGIYDGTGRNVLETVGNAQVNTAVKKYGTGSLKFDGNGDRLNWSTTNYNTPNGNENFTIEGWIYVNAHRNYNFVYSASYPLQIYLDSGGNLNVIANDVDSSASYFGSISGAVTAQQWTHFAYVRNGSNFELFIDGTSAGTATNASAIFLTTTPSSVGDFRETGGTTYAFDGYIDDLRITKGVARYTANFTPPDSALPIKGL